MSRTKFNLVGDTFTHLTGGNLGYATHGKTSRYIEWVQDGSGVGTFYIDDAMEQIDTRGTSRADSFGWLLESKWINSMTDKVWANPLYYIARFHTIFTHDKRLVDLDSTFKFVPAQGSWIREPGPREKTKLVSMIASNKDWTSGHIERLGWVKKLRGRLDLYGRGFNPIEFKEQGLDDYMFSVAIENGQYESYFTEKLLDCFLSCTIPIYSGNPDVGDFFNLDGILRLEDFDSISPELYFEKYEAICDNYDRALKMEVLEDFIYENYLS